MTKMLSKPFLSLFFGFAFVFSTQIVSNFAQSQALDAEIDGIVTDINGSVIPKASITAINVQTGARRTASANDEGMFWFPILSLGLYEIIAENAGFKRFERRGIVLSAGQTASIVIRLEPGNPNESVTVTSDAAIADDSKFAVGRQINSRDVRNLPLVSRNPYNFILLQPGISGRVVRDPSAVNLSANGLRRRVGYQIDGSYDNEANLSGFRLNLISETFVKEMQLLTSGYSAEFGNTAGAVVNVVTPSGTNDLDGTATFLYRPAGLSAKPFGFQTGSASNIDSSGVTATIGGPIRKDRWHFYAGYEWTRRNSITPITITSENRDALIATGLPAAIFVNTTATSDTLPYFIFRTDAKVSDSTRINLRYNRFVSGLKNTGVGGLSTTERLSGFTGYDHAIAAQAVTSFSETFFNEFRFQFAKRIVRTVSNEPGTGVSVTITNVANFGPNPNLGSVGPRESSIQFNNAVTKVFDAHSIKIGGGINFIHDRPKNQISAQYVFPSISAYAAAVNATDRRGYRQYSETFGDAEIAYGGTFLNFFVQDDWRLSRRLKLAIGLRYELYNPPSANADSPLAFSRKFNLDKNNLAPRLGLVYLLRDGKYRTVVRVGSGVHFDPPLLTMYRRANLNNGNPRYFSFSFAPGNAGAPDFPNRLGVFPAGAVIPPRDIDGVSPDFKTMYAVHSNVQVEQAIAENMSVTVGYLYSFARHIPVYRNINCLPLGQTLADGRPIYGTAAINPVTGNVTITSCTSRVFPQFNVVKMAESVGNQNYHGLFVQLTKRFSNGFQFNANYTVSRSRDDAPEENGPGATAQSDPSNRAVDRGNSDGDVTGVFNLSILARPSLRVASRFLDAVLNNNQLGVIVMADTGENFNITSADLNRDGVLGSDRPVGVPRNSGRLPAYLGVNARYSRFFRLGERLSSEFYAEATNVFNHKSVSSYNSTTLTASSVLNSQVNPLTGNLLGPLPDFRNLSVTFRESRQLQLGVRLHF